MEELVTIGILTYNHEKYIEDCLQSIINQDYRNIELIVLDDASKDQTADIIWSYNEKLKERFKRFIFLRNTDNCGNISHNVNRMVKLAKGKYYKSFSGDDILLEQGIRELVGALENSPRAAISIGNGYRVHDKFHVGDYVDKKNIILNRVIQCKDKEDFFEKLCYQQFIPSPAVLIRYKIFDEIGLFDESIPYEDYEFWLRISRKYIFTYKNIPVVLYRRSENSMCNYSDGHQKEKVKRAMLSNGLTLKRYLHYLPKQKRLKCIECYFRKGFLLSYSMGFFRGMAGTLFLLIKYNFSITGELEMLMERICKLT